MIAVEISDRAGETEAVRVLHRCGAVDLEKAEGQIGDDEWSDFDPLSVPQYL